MFNSLKYAKKLEEAGVPREQAETHLMILSEVMESNLATKQNLKDLSADLRSEVAEQGRSLRAEISLVRQELKAEISSVHQELKAEISELRSEMRTGFQLIDAKFIQLEQRMTIKLGAIVSIALGVMLTISKLIQ